MLWLVVLVSAASMWMLLELVLPRPPSRTRRWLSRRAEAVTRRWRQRRAGPPDPFEALWLQSRLGVLADEIRGLETAPRVYARAHRLLALNAAYDDLLDQACRMAGVPDVDQVGIEPGLSGQSGQSGRFGQPGQQVQPGQRGEDLRWREEQELAARGWSW